jgi:hypothetical protein
MTLDEIKQYFSKYFLMPDYKVLDVVLGCILANILDGESTNIYIVGPPSSGKTEALRSLSTYGRIYELDELTPNSFISGWKSDKTYKGTLAKMTEAGQLVCVIKDFTSILTMRSEYREAIIGQIRGIADGKLSKEFGTGTVSWHGKVAFLAAVTPIIDNHHNINQMLGERFLYYRMPNSYDPMEEARQAQSNSGIEARIREDMSGMVSEFLNQFTKSDTSLEVDKDINTKILSLACLVAWARTSISRNRTTHSLNYIPEAERPSRIVKQLTQLGAGIATVQGKPMIDNCVYEIMKKIGLDSVPSVRLAMLTKMSGIKDFKTTEEVSQVCRLAVSTTKGYLDDFMELGIMDHEVSDDGHRWVMADKCRIYFNSI